MAINDFYGVGVNLNDDNVTDNNNILGWIDQSGEGYGKNAFAFGPLINGYGTWGQVRFQINSANYGPVHGNPTGLSNLMRNLPAVAPDNSGWVQGHLVNGEVGGQQHMAAFLTPISHNINMWHAGFESVLRSLMGINAYPRILNTALVYRTHALPPLDGQLFPSGIVVSLGIINNNAFIPFDGNNGNNILTELGLIQNNGAIHIGQNNRQNQHNLFNPALFANNNMMKQYRIKIAQMVGGISQTYI